MGAFDFVDKLIGTDFSGNKARGQIDKALQAALGGNQAGADIMKKYGDEAMQKYEKYTREGMSELDAANKASSDVLGAGYAKGEATYKENMAAGKTARQPYTDAGLSMLKTLPTLQAALGLPGGENTNYNVEASPMYGWQKDQMDAGLTAQLNAMGLNNDNVAAYIRSQNLGELGAEERQRQIIDMQRMVSEGMQASSTLGAPEFQAAQDLSQMQINAGIGQSGLLNNNALARAQMLQGLGGQIGDTTLGIGGNLANNAISAGQNQMTAGMAKAAIPNGMNQLINTGLQLYGMGAFGGGNRPAAVKPAAVQGSGYAPNTNSFGLSGAAPRSRYMYGLGEY